MKKGRLTRSLQQARVLVCAGTGGVGKTTIAAALGIHAARLGRRTLVLTIDPARRLADALGTTDLGSEAGPVDLSAVPGMPAGARLDAMMLETKSTFDRLITRLASDAETRERILHNRIYRHLSEALAGSAEYAAMEQVHEMIEADRYDLIVVDTPPADHALDFLRAPRRLREFLDSRLVRALLHPAVSAGRFGARLFGRSLNRILGVLERIAGVGFLDDLSEFLLAIDSLSQGFQERAARVEEILTGPGTGFVLVCGPHARANTSALEFLDQLEGFDVPLVGVIANRFRRWPLAEPPERVAAAIAGRTRDDALLRDRAQLEDRLRRDRSEHSAHEIGDGIFAILRDEAAHCAAENLAVAEIAEAARRRHLELARVEALDGGVEGLDGLIRIANGFAVEGDAPDVEMAG